MGGKTVLEKLEGAVPKRPWEVEMGPHDMAPFMDQIH